MNCTADFLLYSTLKNYYLCKEIRIFIIDCYFVA